MRRLIGPVLTGVFLVACGDDGGTGGAGGDGDGGSEETTGSSTTGSSTTGSSTTGSSTTGSTGSTTSVTSGSTSSTSSTTSTTSGSTSTSTGMDVCGDGTVGPAEACDDGNGANGDGCSDVCSIESGWSCAGEPSVCDLLGDCTQPIVVPGDGFVFQAPSLLPYGDDLDNSSSSGCAATPGAGAHPDVVFEIALAAGETLKVTDSGAANVVLHLLEGACASATACVASFDGDQGAELASGLSYTSPSAQTLFLVVDTANADPQPSEDVDLVFEISPCGDGVLLGGETCDDGNTTDGDGCSSVCTIEPGAVCSGVPSICANGTCADPILVTAFPHQLAGADFTQFSDDGDYGTGVACEAAGGSDEGPDLVFRVDLVAGDAVTISELSSGTVVMHVLDAPACGPGVACAVSVDTPEEDGATFTATTTGPVFLAVELESENGGYDIVIDLDPCGNGVVAGQQQCDDGNLIAGDGCSPGCTVEIGFGCTGEPSLCTPLPEASCQAPILVTSTPFQYVDTNLVAYGDDADYNPNPGCANAGVDPGDGADLVFRIDLAQGETVGLRELSTVDAVLHILSAGSCEGTPACAASTDLQETAGIWYTASSSGPVYLVVEADDAPGFSEAFDVRIDKWTCGDGVVNLSESCDDGNTTPGDGCSAVCEFETATAALIGTCTGTIYTYAATQSLPSSIPDGAGAPLDLQFVVPQLGTVEKAALRLSITHPNTADLDISLAGPGQALPGVNLSSDNGGSGDDYTNTIFIDGVAKSITGATAPFTGAFSPESSMSVLAGGLPVGVWTLRIDDDLSGNTGSVTFAGLALCITP